MTQPKFAPITEDAEVRPAYRLDPPAPWRAHRPAEFEPGARRDVARLAGTGVPGPDQGYALHLAERAAARLVLADGEHTEDVLAGAVAIALRRAALFGRAPVSTDIELALTLFGYLAPAPTELVEYRRRLFDGAAHRYFELGEVAHLVPEAMLRRSPEQLSNALDLASTLRSTIED